MSKNVRQIQGILFGNTVQITTKILQNCSILSFLSIYHFGNLYLGLCHFSDCNFESKIKLVSRWCHWYTITVLMPPGLISNHVALALRRGSRAVFLICRHVVRIDDKLPLLTKKHYNLTTMIYIWTNFIEKCVVLKLRMYL